MRVGEKLTMSHPTAMSEQTESVSAWETRPLEALVDHIVARYHLPLRALVSDLHTLLQRLRKTDSQQMLCTLVQCFETFREELLLDIGKEEDVLFPWIRAKRGASAVVSIAMMQQDHARIAALVAELCLQGRTQLATRSPGTDALAFLYLERLLTALADLMHSHLALEELLFVRALLS